MKRQFIPETMDDLEEIYYVSENYELRRRYEDYIQTEVFSRNYEKEAIQLFKPIENVTTIPKRKDKATFDLKIDSKRILIEVKSIDIETTEDNIVRRNEGKVINKVDRVIELIEQKDGSECPNYSKGGIIFCTTLFTIFSKIFDLLHDKNFIEKTQITKTDLDFVVFTPTRASINGQNSWEIYPTFFYVKNKSLLNLFKEKFSDTNYKIISLVN